MKPHSSHCLAYSADINTRHLAPTQRQAIEQAQAAILARCGLPPLGKPVAAAHEAGHVVVMAALGDTITGARLVRRACIGQSEWVGVNSRTAPTGCREYGTTADILLEPECGIRLALAEVNGLAGERAAGLDHPSSSLDEIGKALMICCSLSGLFGGDPFQVFAFLERIADALIAANRSTFDVVRGHLHRSGRLTGGEARRMPSSAARTPMPYAHNWCPVRLAHSAKSIRQGGAS